MMAGDEETTKKDQATKDMDNVTAAVQEFAVDQDKLNAVTSYNFTSLA